MKTTLVSCDSRTTFQGFANGQRSDQQRLDVDAPLAGRVTDHEKSHAKKVEYLDV
jgi:hypothetical protein